MERPNTVAGLQAKKKELQGELKAAKKAVKAIKIDIDHIDAATKLFTGKSPRAIPRRDVQFRAEKGEMLRHVLTSLREAKEPLTSQIIADAWCKARGLKADHETYILMRKRVGACLNTLKNRGTIVEIPMEGLHKGWQIETKTDPEGSA
ncbi:MAG: hypothetical protein DHS20C05_07170 [Hyphococcus sp.]|nr:MAG: hypothetical protein DHS20C05_07170 [Marinicaulis sp.]